MSLRTWLSELIGADMSRRDWTYFTQEQINRTPLPAPPSEVERLKLALAEKDVEIAGLYEDILTLCEALDVERERNLTLVVRA